MSFRFLVVKGEREEERERRKDKAFKDETTKIRFDVVPTLSFSNCITRFCNERNSLKGYERDTMRRKTKTRQDKNEQRERDGSKSYMLFSNKSSLQSKTIAKQRHRFWIGEFKKNKTRHTRNKTHVASMFRSSFMLASSCRMASWTGEGVMNICICVFVFSWLYRIVPPSLECSRV
jgi:hypothetical protein